jgi:hypothetical protein
MKQSLNLLRAQLFSTANWLSFNALLVLEVVELVFLHTSLKFFVRLRKAPYADSYWFLYSAKTTYYTERNLTKRL